MTYSRAYVEITNICNRNCSFCPGTLRDKRRMTMEEFQRITAQLQGVTEYIYLHVMGEPLTHPLLPDFITCAKEKGFKVAITTNGTLLRRCQEVLLKARPYKVSISIHSFEEGTLESYLDYLTQCMEFAEQSSREGILTVFRLWNRGYDKGRNVDTLAILQNFFREDWKEGSRGFRIRDKLHLEYGDRFVWPDMEAHEGDDLVFCYGLKDHFGILCDGRVIPCCLDREGAITLGNIYEQPIREILGSERAVQIAQGFRKRRAVEELCRKCGYARRF